MDEIELELLYNQNDICEAFLYQGEAEAVRLFERKIESLARLPEGEELVIRRIFLTSLNRSLYNYILFSHGISLCECCYENIRQLAQAGTAEEFARAGREIIRTYGELTRSFPPKQKRPRTPSVKKYHLVQACRYIDAHIRGPLTLARVAQNIYVSPYYLCQLFKEEKKQNFSEYLNARRIEAAKKLLLGSQMSVDEVAVQCGYGSSSYFSTVFRKQAGVSPREFRKGGVTIKKEERELCNKAPL